MGWASVLTGLKVSKVIDSHNSHLMSRGSKRKAGDSTNITHSWNSRETSHPSKHGAAGTLSEARTNRLILLGGRRTTFGMPVALIFEVRRFQSLCEAVMWRITTRGFTLQEVLILAAMNIATGTVRIRGTQASNGAEQNKTEQT